MELPGTAVSEQVLDLLADPPGMSAEAPLWQQNDRQLVDCTEEILSLSRGVQVALWRQLDAMAHREGGRRAVDVTAEWLIQRSGLLADDARTAVNHAIRMCANPAVLEAYANGGIGEREAKYIVNYIAFPPADMYKKRAEEPGEEPGDEVGSEDADPDEDVPLVPMDEAERKDVRGFVRDFLLLAAGARDFKLLRSAGKELRNVLSREKDPGVDLDRNRLDTTRFDDGRLRLKGEFDTETAENLLAALRPFMLDRPEFDGSPDRRCFSQKQADAFSEMLRRNQPVKEDTAESDSAAADEGSADEASAENYAAEEDAAGQGPEGKDSPEKFVARKGLLPRINVVIPLELLFGHIPTHAERCQMIREGRIEELLKHTGRGWLQWMGSISMAAAQRLACDCELVMVGADENGAPLCVDTNKRFANDKHRTALLVRDRGCAFPNCNRPAEWTQAHHTTPWSVRQSTHIDGLCNLCTYHHAAVHHYGWTVTMDRKRFPIFRPPAKIDPLRRWLNSDGSYVDDPPGPSGDGPAPPGKPPEAV